MGCRHCVVVGRNTVRLGREQENELVKKMPRQGEAGVSTLCRRPGDGTAWVKSRLIASKQAFCIIPFFTCFFLESASTVYSAICLQITKTRLAVLGDQLVTTAWVTGVIIYLKEALVSDHNQKRKVY
jgi:hypothetical protein